MPSFRLLPAVAALPLLAAAFPWTDLTREPSWHRVLWVPFLSGYRIKDVILNVLVTVPIGLACGVARHRLAWLTAVGTAGVVSLFCELAQVFAPDRFPSGTDVLCNVLGAAFGLAVIKAGWPALSAARPLSDSENL